MNNKQKIDEMTIAIFDEAVKLFNSIKRLELMDINVRLETERHMNQSGSRALSRLAEIQGDELVKLESSTKLIKDLAKQIGIVNKEG